MQGPISQWPTWLTPQGLAAAAFDGWELTNGPLTAYINIGSALIRKLEEHRADLVASRPHRQGGGAVVLVRDQWLVWKRFDNLIPADWSFSIEDFAAAWHAANVESGKVSKGDIRPWRAWRDSDLWEDDSNRATPEKPASVRKAFEGFG